MQLNDKMADNILELFEYNKFKISKIKLKINNKKRIASKIIKKISHFFSTNNNI